MDRRVSLAGVLLGLVAVSGFVCAGSGGAPAPAPASAALPYAEVQRVFDAKCTTCHSGVAAAAGLRLDSWSNLIRGSSHGEVVIAYDPEHSVLVEMATKLAGGPHPREQGGAAMTNREVERVSRWIRDGARSDAGDVPYEGAAQLLYVCNQDDALISVIDMDAKVVIRTVDLRALGFSATAKPHHTAVEPDGSHWYVSLIGDGKVLKFDRDNALVGQADFEVPGLLAMHPTDDVLFVGRSMAAVNPPQRIGVIRRSDMSIEEIDVFFPRPHALAVDRRRAYVYSGSLAENRIATIDRATEDVEFTSLDGPTHVLVQFAVSPADATIVVGGQLSGKLFVFDTGDPGSLMLSGVIDVEAGPWHPVYAPDGRFVYVGNKDADAVTVVDMQSRTVARVIRGVGLSQPHGAAVSPDGEYLFVSNSNLKGGYTPRHRFGDNDRSGTVVVINTTTGAMEKVLEVERYPSGASTRTRN